MYIYRYVLCLQRTMTIVSNHEITPETTPTGSQVLLRALWVWYATLM